VTFHPGSGGINRKSVIHSFKISQEITERLPIGHGRREMTQVAIGELGFQP
jgi:hypothetical protein